ncbi:MAG: hypothetical protein QG667_2045, partial [Pseudomonadota bacterium]|nr:hypothetical protein [Pseudomonadota bacterium]
APFNSQATTASSLSGASNYGFQAESTLPEINRTPMTRFTSLLFQQANLADCHTTVDSLAHIVNSQQRHRGCR